MQRNKSNVRGITLIALVVTIVVLLILAAVSISMLSGENGIIRQAQEAKDKSEYGQLKELVRTKITHKNMEFAESIEPYLRNLENEHQGIIVEKVADDTYYVTKGKATVTVYDDKDTKGTIVDEKIELWDGTEKSPKFKEFNWYIYTPSQLKFLSTYVNNGNTLTANQEELLAAAGYNPSDVTMTADTVIYLMNDLDLGARASEGNWETTENKELKWTPIGDSSGDQLLGTFDGNNHTIRGVYVNEASGENGIFGISSSIKNLTVKNSYVKGSYNTGGIVGGLQGNIENCHNINTTVSLTDGVCSRVGGIVGVSYMEGTVIKDCTNRGNVKGYSVDGYGNSMTGGIVGQIFAESIKIENCNNNGTIEGEGGYVGGVCGDTYISATISNCSNEGEVIGKEDNVGGVLGNLHISANISNCSNKGKVTGGIQFIGGITGGTYGSCTISNCKNEGEVIGKSSVGGIAGMANPATTMSNCYNIAKVEGIRNHIGGILGYMGTAEGTVTNSKVEKCYNAGEVKSEGQYVGGIVGDILGTSSTVVKCYNKAKIVASNKMGAIIGHLHNNIANTLNNSYYFSSVGIGAIEGEDDTSNNMMSTTEEIKTYEEFLTWIESK